MTSIDNPFFASLKALADDDIFTKVLGGFKSRMHLRSHRVDFFYP